MLAKKNIIYLLIAVFAAGTFLRFFNLAGFTTFLGDQGRDAIIVKRIVTFEHFPAIGAPSSVSTPKGYIYLGPFYYYFLAPFRLLSADPIVLAAAVALVNSLSIIGVYVMAVPFFGPVAAFLTAVLIAFSQVNIALSRYSWNPNMLPFFSAMAFFAYLNIIRRGRKIDYILFGILTALSLQLHYLYLAVFPAYAIATIFLIRRKSLTVKQLVPFWMSAVAFGIFSSPLLVFDLRHNFQNIQAFMSLFSHPGGVLTGNDSFLQGIIATFELFFGYVIRIPVDIALLGALIITIIAAVSISLRRAKSIYLAVTTIVTTVSLIIIALYQGHKFEHYFTSVYYLFYIMIAAVIADLIGHKEQFVRFMGTAFIIIYVLNNLTHLDFLQLHPSYEIDHARAVADAIKTHVRRGKYTLTTLPDKYSDSTYRYFLEIAGKRPIEKDSVERADELFVLCETAAPCKPIGDPQWDIAFFAPKAIDGQWKVKGVTIYRLIH